MNLKLRIRELFNIFQRKGQKALQGITTVAFCPDLS